MGTTVGTQPTEAVAEARVGNLSRAGEGPVLVRRDEQHRLVVVKDVLCPVAVVHVKVDDGDPLDDVGVLPQQIPRRERRVVHQAEPHRPRGARVVAGRADEGKPGRRRKVVDCLVAGDVRRVAPHDLVDHRLDDAGRRQRVDIRRPRQVRALVQHQPRDGHRLARLVAEGRQVPLVVHEKDVLEGRRGYVRVERQLDEIVMVRVQDVGQLLLDAEMRSCEERAHVGRVQEEDETERERSGHGASREPTTTYLATRSAVSGWPGQSWTADWLRE